MRGLLSTTRRFGAALVVVAMLATLAWWAEWYPPGISGAVRVIDGDSLVVEGVEIRLFGIDAPEARQSCVRDGKAWPCGREATRRLRAMIAGRAVACRAREEDRYGRAVATCEAGADDLGAMIVRSGFAVAYGAYEAEERSARDHKRGIWDSTFETPAVWRARHPRPHR